MTREIEFRAWDNSTKTMMSHKQVLRHFHGCYEIDIDPFEDKHLTYMQYTSLKDKNGKKIFEGDVVKIMQKTKTLLDKVIYDNHLCGFRFEGSVNGGYCDFCDWLREGAEFEVIGDIYQNPELLGGNND